MPATFAPLNISDNLLLWIMLAILLLLVVAVGQKASASDVEFSSSYASYKRPMLALELHAGSAAQMFKSWDEAKEKLRLAIWWDYLFIFIYPAAIATACFIAARFLDRHSIVAFKYSLVIILAQMIAALLDAVEDFALLRVLRGPIESPWPQIARWCAISKFSLIIAGIIYALVVGGGAWLITLVIRGR